MNWLIRKVLDAVRGDPGMRWKLKQELAKPGRYYGDGGTIHLTGRLDVEVHDGKVVAVWFRCTTPPFEVHEVNAERARRMEQHHGPVQMTGVEVVDAR